MNIYLTNSMVLFVLTLSSYFFLKYIFDNKVKPKTFNFLFFYHLFFILIFFLFSKYKPTDAIKYYIDSFNHSISGNYFYFGSNFVKKLSSILIDTLKLDFYSLNLLFGTFGTFGILILVSLAEKRINLKGSYYYFIIFLLCIPTLNFFTSHLGKDSLMFFAICLFIWSIDGLEKFKLTFLIFSLFLMISIRMHIAIPIIFIFLLFVPLIIKNVSKLEKIIYYSTFIFCFSIALYYQVEILVTAGVISELGGMTKNPGLFNLDYIFDKMDVYSRNTSSAESTYKIMHSNDFIYYFKYLFGPYLLEGNFNLQYLIVKAESLIYLSIVILAFLLTGLTHGHKTIFYKNIMLLTIFFALTIPLSLSVSNYGISIRQRVTIYPFLIYMLILNIEYFLNEKKINFNIFKSNNY